MHFKHDIIKMMKNSCYCIVSFRSTILVQDQCERKDKKKKDVFFKSECLSRQMIRREKRKHQQAKKPCLCGQKKQRSITMIWKQKKNWTKIYDYTNERRRIRADS
jgi:hypothetical protein